MLSRIMTAALLASSATIAAQSVARPQEPLALVNATVVNVVDGSLQPTSAWFSGLAGSRRSGDRCSPT